VILVRLWIEEQMRLLTPPKGKQPKEFTPQGNAREFDEKMHANLMLSACNLFSAPALGLGHWAAGPSSRTL
jgi:hypothetical protein